MGTGHFDAERIVEMDRQVRSLLTQNPDWGARRMAKALNIPRATAQRSIYRVRKNNPETAFEKQESSQVREQSVVEWDASGFTATLKTEHDRSITFDDVVEKAGIDLAVWEPVGKRKIRDYEVTMKMKEFVGPNKVVRYYDKTIPMRSIECSFALRPFNIEKFESEALELVRGIKPPLPPKPKREKGAPCAAHIGIYDLHVGKLAPAYSLDEIRERNHEALSFFLGHTAGRNVEKIIFPVGNDALHVDNDNPAITSKGTPQQVSAFGTEMILMAKRIMIESVLMCSEVAPVEVVLIPGNHSKLGDFAVGLMVEAFFEGAGSNRVQVRFDKNTNRVYSSYGITLNGWMHGDKSGPNTKLKDLAFRMIEESGMWDDTQLHQMNLGHFHQRKVETEGTFTVMYWPSLSEADKWHLDKGFMSVPASVMQLIDKKWGPTEDYTYRPRTGIQS